MEEDRFGPYTVYERLGAGGMATVHRATIPIGAGVIREVALKRLLPQLADDRQFVADFIREAKLAAQLDHPSIVHILELGHTENTYFIAMELVRGQPLTQLMKRARALKQATPIGVVVAVLAEVCDALDHASNGRGIYGQPLHIVHRDLTPSNLIVTDEGRVKLIDFGVAKALTGKFMTNTGLVKGKLGYMSVEALSGSAVDARTDLFSVGVVAWELLTGERLFTGVNEIDVILKIRRGEVAPPSTINPACPAVLDAIVVQALARNREDRWSSASAMRRALDGLRRDFQAGPSHVGAWKHGLIPRVPRTVVRADSQGTATQVQPALAEGSGRRPSHTDLPTRPLRPALDHITLDDEPTALDAQLSEAVCPNK